VIVGDLVNRKSILQNHPDGEPDDTSVIFPLESTDPYNAIGDRMSLGLAIDPASIALEFTSNLLRCILIWDIRCHQIYSKELVMYNLIEFTGMQDSNMLYAYFWACRLTQDMLPTSLKDVEMRATLIDKIDFPIAREDNTANILLEYMTEDERLIRLGRALSVADSFLTDQISEISKKSVILRLWSGCLDAAKSIATETLDGATSPERRKQQFFQIDIFAKWDSIYRAGVETAPALKKRRKQYYSFDGVPDDSRVRRFPNEFLLQ
jgi:hypothetical protein